MRAAITQSDLGASTYVPATMEIATLVSIANGKKYPDGRSYIFCTEDAVLESELPLALHNLKHALKRFSPNEGPLRFIRVRTPGVLARLLEMKGIENIDGFVLPKITVANLPVYLANLSDHDPFYLMPTLETSEVFEADETRALRRMILKDERARKRILCLRIGGNDLLNVLGVDRDPELTIYDTGVGPVIKRLAGEFIPHGIGLTAPVYGEIDERYQHVLRQEIRLDLQQGLFGKTAIHPTQIAIIESMFKVSRASVNRAERILDADARAVFKLDGRMCEPATHRSAARITLERAQKYGVIE